MEIYKLIYKKENNINNLRILGETFVKNNRNKGGLIIKNKKYYLKDILSVNKTNLDILKIKMILNRYTYNFNCLFKDCISLTSLSTSSIDNTIDNVIYEENISEKKTLSEIAEVKMNLHLVIFLKYRKLKEIIQNRQIQCYH